MNHQAARGYNSSDETRFANNLRRNHVWLSYEDHHRQEVTAPKISQS